MYNLQRAFDFLRTCGLQQIRPNTLAEALDIRKDYARGLLRALAWLGALKREETPRTGVSYRIIK